MNATPNDTTYSAVRREQALTVDYANFTAALESLLGRMKLEDLADIAQKGRDGARRWLSTVTGSSGFALFQKIDHGSLLSVVADKPTRASTYVFGSALIAVEMTQHDPRVGLYVPPRLYVREVSPGRILVTWDLLSATLSQFGNPEINAVARALDDKIAALIDSAARRADVDPHARA